MHLSFSKIYFVIVHSNCMHLFTNILFFADENAQNIRTTEARIQALEGKIL